MNRRKIVRVEEWILLHASKTQIIIWFLLQKSVGEKKCFIYYADRPIAHENHK